MSSISKKQKHKVRVVTSKKVVKKGFTEKKPFLTANLFEKHSWRDIRLLRRSKGSPKINTPLQNEVKIATDDVKKNKKRLTFKEWHRLTKAYIEFTKAISKKIFYFFISWTCY